MHPDSSGNFVFDFKVHFFGSFLRTLFLRMSSLCQVRADTNLAIENFIFNLISTPLIRFALFQKTGLRQKGRRRLRLRPPLS